MLQNLHQTYDAIVKTMIFNIYNNIYNIYINIYILLYTFTILLYGFIPLIILFLTKPSRKIVSWEKVIALC